jgi:hypothetical protein
MIRQMWHLPIRDCVEIWSQGGSHCNETLTCLKFELCTIPGLEAFQKPPYLSQIKQQIQIDSSTSCPQKSLPSTIIRECASVVPYSSTSILTDMKQQLQITSSNPPTSPATQFSGFLPAQPSPRSKTQSREVDMISRPSRSNQPGLTKTSPLNAPRIRCPLP